MKREIKFKVIFGLTKLDINDFEREEITRALGILPTESEAPRLCKGKALCEDIENTRSSFRGVTFIDQGNSMYKMMSHACWNMELPLISARAVDAALDRLSEVLRGKEAVINCLCNDYGLFAEIIVKVYAYFDDLPEMCLSSENIAFCASIHSSLDFEFLLD